MRMVIVHTHAQTVIRMKFFTSGRIIPMSKSQVKKYMARKLQ